MITPVAIAAHEPPLTDNSLDWFGTLPLFILAELFVFTVYILIPCALHEPVCDFLPRFMCRCLLDIYIGLQNCGIRLLIRLLYYINRLLPGTNCRWTDSIIAYTAVITGFYLPMVEAMGPNAPSTAPHPAILAAAAAAATANLLDTVLDPNECAECGKYSGRPCGHRGRHWVEQVQCDSCQRWCSCRGLGISADDYEGDVPFSCPACLNSARISSLPRNNLTDEQLACKIVQ
eukprot:COSAG05_NODE_3072_length_2354_cov_25.847007_2_plen_232_part_00